MFCPNCGAENKETTVSCDRCGFKLSGVSASKFKGTIMLNTEESVQKLIEAEKLKRAFAQNQDPQQAGSETPPPVNADLPPATPNPAGVPRPRGVPRRPGSAAPRPSCTPRTHPTSSGTSAVDSCRSSARISR